MKLKLEFDISDRITPENITELKDNEIFCFGSNTAGKHGLGAAKLAFEKFDAIWNVGFGFAGNTYAIPTKDKYIKTMNIEVIKTYVDDFITDATNYSTKHFLVTKVGCGLAGIPIKTMAELFKNAIYIENISLPLDFWKEYGLIE